MVYIVLIIFFIILVYSGQKVYSYLVWYIGEGSLGHFNLSVENSIFDKPLIRKLIGISENYKDKKFSELPETENKKIKKFAIAYMETLCPSFLFFYDKQLVFTSIEGKGYFSPIKYGDESSLYTQRYDSEDYKNEIAFIISRRIVDNVIPAQKIEVYTGYLKDMEFNSDKEKSEKIDILFNVPVVLALPLPRFAILNNKMEKEKNARRELAKKFDLEYEDGESGMDGFEGDFGNYIYPSMPGCYKSKYFSVYV